MPCLVIITGNHTASGGAPGSQVHDTWYSSVQGLGDPSFKPAPMPSSRSEASAAPLGPSLIGVFGGHELVSQGGGAYYYDSIDYNEVYNYDSNSWAVRTPMPQPLSGLAAAPLGQSLAGVFGLGHTAVYDYASNTWAAGAPMITPRYGLTAAPLGQGLAGTFGGGVLGLPSTHACEVYNYGSDTWAMRTPMPTDRYFLAAAALGPGLAGVFGGIQAIINPDGHTGSFYSKDVNEVYDYDSNTWTVRAPMPHPLWGLAAAPLDQGLVGVFGGHDPIYISGTLVYNYTSDTWTTKAPMPTLRLFLAAAELGGGIVATAGGEEYGAFNPLSVNEVYVY